MLLTTLALLSTTLRAEPTLAQSAKSVTPAPASATLPTLTMRFEWLVDNLDWQVGRSSNIVIGNIMEGLFELDDKLLPVPRLAQSYSVSADNQLYTIQLKSGVKWSDGVPLEARHFVDGLRRLLDPLTVSQGANALFVLEGAREFKSGTLKDFSEVGVRAVSPQMLELRLRRPMRHFIERLSHFPTFPIRKDLIDRHGAAWQKPGKLAVLGPYTVEESIPNQKLVLRRNAQYHGNTARNKERRLERVVIEVVNDTATNVRDFQSGRHDFVRVGRLLDVKPLLNTPAFRSSPALSTQLLLFNPHRSMLALPAVRRALAMAIDRTKLGSVLQDKLHVAKSLIHPMLVSGLDEANVPFDPAGALKLLNEAGVRPAQLSDKLVLAATSNDESALVVNFIRDELNKNLGIKTGAAMLKADEFRSHLELRDYDIYYSPMYPEYNAPEAYLDNFQSDATANMLRWKNAQYDDTVRRMQLLPPGAERDEMVLKASRILQHEQAIVLPLFYNRFAYLLNPKIEGFRYNTLGRIYLRDAIRR